MLITGMESTSLTLSPLGSLHLLPQSSASDSGELRRPQFRSMSYRGTSNYAFQTT